MAGKATKPRLADLAAEAAAKAARTTLKALTDEQLTELDATADKYPHLSHTQLVKLVQQAFGVTVGRSAISEHLRRRRAAQ